jgi:1,4-alpha-glucan branching enzyme
MPKYLRPEARPADWRSLDEAQQKAFRQVVERATEAIETIPDPKLRREARPESTHWLSEDRTSRTVFLSGARGTGKTTVMMSLIKASTEESGEAVRKSFPEDLHYGLNLMRQRALWLEPVDMAHHRPRRIFWPPSWHVSKKSYIDSVGEVGVFALLRLYFPSNKGRLIVVSALVARGEQT